MLISILTCSTEADTEILLYAILDVLAKVGFGGLLLVFHIQISKLVCIRTLVQSDAAVRFSRIWCLASRILREASRCPRRRPPWRRLSLSLGSSLEHAKRPCFVCLCQNRKSDRYENTNICCNDKALHDLFFGVTCSDAVTKLCT